MSKLPSSGHLVPSSTAGPQSKCAADPSWLMDPNFLLVPRETEGGNTRADLFPARKHDAARLHRLGRHRHTTLPSASLVGKRGTEIHNCYVRLSSGTKQTLPNNSECRELYLALRMCMYKGCAGTASLKDSSHPSERMGRCIPKPAWQFRALRGSCGHTVL